jgi:hypothetical protein
MRSPLAYLVLALTLCFGGCAEDTPDAADPCATSVCGNGGTCLGLVDGGVFCKCAAGFSGDRCEVNIDDCPTEDPCVHGACVDGVDAFTCACDAGYEGVTCEAEIDECAPNPCPDTATCVDRLAGYECVCNPGNAGPDCACSLESVVTLPDSGIGGALSDNVLGFEFQPSQDIVVGRLGAVDWSGTIIDESDTHVEVTGLTAPVAVGLYDVEGLIASVSVEPDGPSADGYRWAAIEPVTLTAGMTYGVMAVFFGDNAWAYESSGADVTVDPRITVTNVLDTSGIGTLPPTMQDEHAWTNSNYTANIGIEACP